VTNSGYAGIILDNLEKLYSATPEALAGALPARQEGDSYLFQAFGQDCRLQPDRIMLGGQEQTGAIGIVISLYALNVLPEPCRLEPLQAFRDIPNSMPYVGAFTTHAEKIMTDYVAGIKTAQKRIMEELQGHESPPAVGGDFSFVLYPLPKIGLCYIFYEADEEFPASVTCLFSSNAHLFLPVDPLADTAEYTSKKILSLLD